MVIENRRGKGVVQEKKFGKVCGKTGNYGVRVVQKKHLFGRYGHCCNYAIKQLLNISNVWNMHNIFIVAV